MNSHFALASPRQRYALAELLPTLLQPVAAPCGIVAIQSPNTLAYVTTLLRYWHQGFTVLPLDPKIPRAEIDALLTQESITQELYAEDLRLLDVAVDRRNGHTVDPANWVKMEQPVSLIRTSGSSAYPKLAQHTWANHVFSARGSQHYLPLTPQDSWLLSLPLFHVGGLAIVVRSWLAGATIQVPDPDQSLAEAILCFRPSHLSLVPTQLQRLLRFEETRQALQGCRAILLGGAPASATLLKDAQAADLPIHTSYGSTEMSSQITTTPPGFWQRTPVEADRLLSGMPLPYREVRIVQGQVQVRGKTLFQGYRYQGQLTLPLNEEGWLNTGDLGVWHEEHLQITGRQDYQFISGGENIQPEEVERHLLGCPGILDAMVVPVEDAEFGQRPVAFLKVQDKAILSGDVVSFLAEVTAFLRQHLPKFKVPMAFYPWPEHLQGHRLKPGRKDFQQQGQVLWQSSRTLDVIWRDMLR